MLPASDMVCEGLNAGALSEAAAATVSTTRRPVPGATEPGSGQPSQLGVCTLVLWLGCSLVAALGLAMPYQRPVAIPAPPEPTRVELLQVELSPEPLSDPALPASATLTAPPPPDAILPAQPQPIVAVAMPSPTIAFAVPVDGPARVVAPAQADHPVPSSSRDRAGGSVQPEVQQLVFGQGAGNQPAPEYPLAAERAGQEGVVRVRLTVAENGRVTAAEAVIPSPWPLLNESAVRTVRRRWRFASGPLRAYDVAIRFVLPK